MSTIHLACDHAGLDLKDILKHALEERGFSVTDHGTHTRESCDYPQFAHALCHAVEAEADGRGILICGTGIGMSMAANRLTRRHNNANVLCLGARITGVELARAIMAAFLDTDFEGGRHQRRLDQLTIQPAKG